MPDFSQIHKVVFPKKVVGDAFEFMREAGREGYESVTLFAGRDVEGMYQVLAVYIPVQYSYKTEYGLMYEVSSDELSKLDDWLYDNKLSLFCQMHTHPEEAYHSTADDDRCIVTSIGGISIVIPRFAQDEVDIRNWAVYRLKRKMGWTELDERELQSFISIV
jgi:hypothetical protein